MTDPEDAQKLIDAEAAQLKQRITDDKFAAKREEFDPGAAMLGTDNEAGAAPDPDGMAQARNAPPPKSA